jgi:Family of unknown function (DUF6090)
MIKFFRKIRQNLLSEGKTGKYFKYAVGEIVLVIIGILIALSINNWNGDRKLKIEEQQYLKDLQSEMASNIEGLNKILEIKQRSYDMALKIDSLFDNREAFNTISDSVFGQNVFTMMNNATFDPKLGILNSLISSGKINNICNKELLYSLSSLKDRISDALEDQVIIERDRNDYVRSIFIRTSTVIDGKYEGIKFKNRYDDPEFRIMVKMLYVTFRRNGLYEERELLETFKHIESLIEQEIKE